MNVYTLVIVTVSLAALGTAACSSRSTATAETRRAQQAECDGRYRIDVTNPLGNAVDVFAADHRGRQHFVGTVDAGGRGSFLLPFVSSGHTSVRWSGPERATVGGAALRNVHVRVQCN